MNRIFQVSVAGAFAMLGGVASANGLASKLSLELSVGGAFSSSRESNIENRLAQLGENSITVAEERREGAFRVALGYKLTTRLSIAAGYMNLGDATTSVTGSANNTTAVAQAVADNAALSPSGGFLELSYKLPLARAWDLELSAGWLDWNAEVNAVSGLSVEREGDDPFAGLGFTYQVADDFLIGLSYYYLTFDDQHSNLLLLRLIAQLSE